MRAVSRGPRLVPSPSPLGQRERGSAKHGTSSGWYVCIVFDRAVTKIRGVVPEEECRDKAQVSMHTVDGDMNITSQRTYAGKSLAANRK